MTTNRAQRATAGRHQGPESKPAGGSGAIDPLNPYATIGLVSALFGLFWIAIPYSLMGLRRPGGEGQAGIGLFIGFVELTAAVVAIIIVVLAVTGL